MMQSFDKTVVLWGGSFNPPHTGHFEMAKHIYEKLDVDEIWFLFSNNPHKPPEDYASIDHRLAMADLLLKNYPDMPFVMSSIQDELGIHVSHEVLEKLRDLYPTTRFIWAIGADSMYTFHKWKNFRAILENHPIVVVDRPDYSNFTEESITAVAYRNFNLVDPERLTQSINGWCMIDTPLNNMASSDIRRALATGRIDFDPELQPVIDYIIEHGLYGLGDNHQPNNQPETQAKL